MLTDVASSGDREAMLRALRVKVAEQMDATESARDVAPLSRELRAIDAELAEVAPDAGEAGDTVDEIAERRAARGAGPATSAGRSRTRSS